MHLCYILFYRLVIVILNSSTLQLLDSQRKWAGVKKIDMLAASTSLHSTSSPCPSLLYYESSVIQILVEKLKIITMNLWKATYCFKKGKQSFDRFVF